MTKKQSRTGVRTVLLFLFAAVLLVVGGIGTATASPLIKSEYYSGGVEMYDIGVTLCENGEAVSSRNYTKNERYVTEESYAPLLATIVPEGEQFHMGQTYSEVLTVKNTGNIDEYVRATVYKYWMDENGKKLTTLSPDMIDLNLVTGSGWIEDETLSTTERTVLYYREILPIGEETQAFSDTLTVSGTLPFKVTQTEKDGVITTKYDYENVTFQIEVHVDAVQTHNAAAAIKSAWGCDVTVYDDGTLSIS